MKYSYLTTALLFGIFAISCQSNNTEQGDTEAPAATESATTETTGAKGFDSLEALAASVVDALQARDYDEYYTHIMTKEMELSQAEKITDPEIRKEFLHEYGFSLHEEEEYFKDMIMFFDSKNIDLANVVLDDMEYTEYKGGEYQPLQLYEVFVPVEMEYEMLIDFTAIKVEDQFYLTSELGI